QSGPREEATRLWGSCPDRLQRRTLLGRRWKLMAHKLGPGADLVLAFEPPVREQGRFIPARSPDRLALSTDRQPGIQCTQPAGRGHLVSHMASLPEHKTARPAFVAALQDVPTLQATFLEPEAAAPREDRALAFQGSSPRVRSGPHRWHR